MGGRRVPGWVWWVVAVGAIGTVLRVAGVFDDFWLDEIFSWAIARVATSASDVFVSRFARTDNNHLLNTLFLYVLGDRSYWPVYRLLALVAGIAAVPVTAVGMRRVGRVEAVSSAILVGLSYPLVFYSSEARGYAPAVCFAAVAWVAMASFVRRRTWGMAVAFVAAAVLGMLSHLTFVHFYLACAAYSTVELGRRRRWVDLAALHGPVVGVGAAIYFGFVRHLFVLGGPKVETARVIWETLRLFSGGSAIAAVAVLAGAFVVVWRARREWFWFYVVGIVVAPGVFLLVRREAEPLFPRYFVVPVWMALAMVGMAIGVVWWNRAGRVVTVVLLGAFVVGNLVAMAPFLRYGRGHYRDAIVYIATHTTSPRVTVAGDNEFRTRPVVDFYARYAPAGKTIEQFPSEPPEWFLIGSLEPGVAPASGITVGDRQYGFEREFTYRGLSGWSWYLYHRRGSGVGGDRPPTHIPPSRQ